MSAKNTKKGFTLIEVILFLAISSAILLAILSGANRSLHQQRYNESVQDLYSFLKNQYTSVISVENVSGNGQSNKKIKDGIFNGGEIYPIAIYGKLIVIKGNGSVVKSYTVFGRVLDASLSGIADTSSVESIFNDSYVPLWYRENEKTDYSLQWGSKLKFTDNTDMNTVILIIRSPLNGAIYTYIPSKRTQLSDCAANKVCNPYYAINDGGSNKFADAFQQGTMDICVASDDLPSGSKKRNIRITNSGSVDSVRLIKMDDNDTTPDVDGGIKGNRCL